MDRLLTVQDLRKFGIGRDKAYQLMHNKAFPAIKIGGRYYVTEEALNAWLKKYQHKQFVL